MARHITETIAIYLIAALGLGLSACGGGSASTPGVASTSPQATYLATSETVNPQINDLTEKINLATGQSTPNAVQGIAPISLKALASSEAEKGSPELLADMVSYQRKAVYLLNPIKTDIARNANGKTTITVLHQAHGLHLGDRVAFKNLPELIDGLPFSINGIAGTKFSQWNYVIPVHPDRYEITVDGSTNVTSSASLDISVEYLIVDCSGRFNYLKTPISDKPLPISVEGVQVYNSTTTVASRLQGCAPEYYGDTKTVKYYKKDLAASYELVAQEIAGGDYSFVLGKWDLPDELLRSDDAVNEKTIGKLKNYTDKTRSYTDGYAIASFLPKKNTSSSVFLFSYLRNYADSGVLMSTETDIYAPIPGDATGSMGLIKKIIDYNNTQKTFVEIQNFIPAPDVATFAVQNGYSASEAAEIKLTCKDLLLLSCIRYYMPGANVFFGPPPSYVLSSSAASIVEGTSVTFTLTTLNVSPGTLFLYTLTGSSNATSASIAKSSGSLIVDANGQATLNLVVPPNSFMNGPGSVTMNVASQTVTVSVVGDTSPPQKYFPIGGTVSGLGAGKTLKILNSGVEVFTTSTNGTFAFITAIAENAAYSVSVFSQPQGQTCTVANPSGNAVGIVRNIQIDCGEAVPNSYQIGGVLSGLLNGMTVKLDLNSNQTLVLSQNGAFKFSRPVIEGLSYTARVAQQPTRQNCTVAKPSGVAYRDVNSLEVRCINLIPAYTLSVDADAISESATVTFTLSTQNVAEGTVLPYTLVGTKNAVGQSATGSLTIGSNGMANVSVTVPSNNILGDSGKLTMTIAGRSKEVIVNDVTPAPPATPVYTLSANANAISEGGTVTFTLSTQNVAAGTVLSYTLAGTNNAAGQSSSGGLSIGGDGLAMVSVTVPSNLVFNDSGTLTIAVAGLNKVVSVKDATVNPSPVMRKTSNYIEFTDLGTLFETLSLTKVLTPNPNDGAISIVGNMMYRGNGSNALPIGTVDSQLDGTAGKALRINYKPQFPNNSFDNGVAGSTVISGWTVINQRILLDGTSTVAGWPTPIDTVLAPGGGAESTAFDAGRFDTRLTNDTYAGEGLAVVLSSNLDGVQQTKQSPLVGGVIHGPVLFSNTAVSLSVGDKVAFDWKAQGGGDAFDIYAYLVDERTGQKEEILNLTGASMYDMRAWSTTTHNVVASGNYKFVFVSGSWDATGGTVAGAKLFIDNVITIPSSPIVLTDSQVVSLRALVQYQYVVR